jgi:predicted RNA-binding protein with PIN domain
MPLIIDGYNVLFAIARHGARSVAEAIEEARGRLLRHLARYHQAAREPITIVFDQSRHTGGATREERQPGVRILYAHPPRTADDDIRRMVQASAAPARVRVVTSDRQLARACAECGAQVVGAMAFYRELADLERHSRDDEHEHRIKTQPPSDDEVREWLRLFSEDGSEEP